MNRPSPPPDADRQTYYERGESWARDIQGGLRRSRRLAWGVAATAATVAVLEGFALLALTPLKTVVPYAFVVDRQTGYVETVRPLQAGALSQDVAVTQSYLVRYVLARETFDMADLNENYRRTATWSVGPARESYLRLMAPTNPENPLKTLSRSAQVAVTVKSVSLLKSGVALVRFGTDRQDDTATAQHRDFVAVVGYRYVGRPMRMGDRFDNPLGFEVTSYRRDAEAPSPPPALVGAVGAAGPATS